MRREGAECYADHCPLAEPARRRRAFSAPRARLARTVRARNNARGLDTRKSRRNVLVCRVPRVSRPPNKDFKHCQDLLALLVLPVCSSVTQSVWSLQLYPLQNMAFYWDNNDGFKSLVHPRELYCVYPRARHTQTRGRRLAEVNQPSAAGPPARLPQKRPLAFWILRGVVQRPCRGPHDVHGVGDGPGVVAHEGNVFGCNSQQGSVPCSAACGSAHTSTEERPCY